MRTGGPGSNVACSSGVVMFGNSTVAGAHVFASSDHDHSMRWPLQSSSVMQFFHWIKNPWPTR